MNDDLDWTWMLGGAVVGQQKDVMNAIKDSQLLLELDLLGL